MNVLYVGGSFDLFHAGHVELLREARLMTAPSTTWVAVNSDRFHEAYRGKPPVMSERDRLAVILACRYVDHAFIMQCHESQRGTIANIKPSHIVHGNDWMGDGLLNQLGIDQAFLDELGIRMLYIDRTTGLSTTGVKARVAG